MQLLTAIQALKAISQDKLSRLREKWRKKDEAWDETSKFQLRIKNTFGRFTDFIFMKYMAHTIVSLSRTKESFLADEPVAFLWRRKKEMPTQGQNADFLFVSE